MASTVCHQHPQLELEAGIRKNRVTTAAAAAIPQRSSKSFRFAIAAACIAAAAVVMYSQTKSGDEIFLESTTEYDADTEDNIFSRRYLSPAQRAYLAAHPPAPPKAKPAKIIRQKPAVQPLIRYTRQDEDTFLQDVPGMDGSEMNVLFEAASAGPGARLKPDEVKPRMLSLKTIDEEDIRAKDVFSRQYGHAVPTAGNVMPSRSTDTEVEHGEAAAVMREAGKAFAIAEGNKPEQSPSTAITRSRLSNAARMIRGYMPAHKTSSLAGGLDMRQTLDAVPPVDADVMSQLDTESNEIEHMHIMSAAQRELLDPSSVEDIDKDLLKQSINNLDDVDVYTSPGRGEHYHEQQRAARLNGYEGSTDRQQQMKILQSFAQPQKSPSMSMVSLAKELQGDSDWKRRMKAAVERSDVAVPPANVGDQGSVTQDVVRDEMKEMHQESKINNRLTGEASSLWPSDKISRQEEEREARRKRELEEYQRSKAQRDKQLKEDAEAALRAKESAARAEKEEKAAITERRKALERERLAREREHIHLQHIEEQEAASPQNQASKHSIRELATPTMERQKVGKERHMQQGTSAERETAERKAARKAQALKKPAEDKQQRMWAKEATKRLDEQRKQEANHHLEHEQKQKIAEDYGKAHSEVQRQQLIRRPQEVPHQAISYQDLSKTLEDLQTQIASKTAERKATERGETEEQRHASKSLGDLSLLDTPLDLNTDVAFPSSLTPPSPPTPAAVAVGKDPSWDNLMSFMDGSGGGVPSVSSLVDTAPAPPTPRDESVDTAPPAAARHKAEEDKAAAAMRRQEEEETVRKRAEVARAKRAEEEEIARKRVQVAAANKADEEAARKKSAEDAVLLNKALETSSPAPAHAAFAGTGADPSWGNLLSFMNAAGSGPAAPLAYKAAVHAQSVALNADDNQAEKRAEESITKHELKQPQLGNGHLPGLTKEEAEAAAEVSNGDMDDEDKAGAAAIADLEGKPKAKPWKKYKNFKEFMSKFKNTQAKEKHAAEMLKIHEADEKNDVAQLAKLRKEKEENEGDDSNALLKVAEVLGSVGAGGLLSAAMGSIHVPKVMPIGSGAALAKKAMAKSVAGQAVKA